MHNKFTPSIPKVNIHIFSEIYSLNSLNTSTMCPLPITHVPHHPCPPSRSLHYYCNVPHHPSAHCPSPMCPITLPLCSCTHCPCAPLLMWYVAHMPITLPHVELEGGHTTLPICPITHLSILTSHMMVTKNTQNVHRKYF